MTSCPRCGSIEVRIHGSRVHAEFSKRWWFFGRFVPRATPVALEVSCAHCLFAFIFHNDGTTRDAPIQTAADQLSKLQAGISDAVTKDRSASAEDKPALRLLPRPAPDPRSRRR